MKNFDRTLKVTLKKYKNSFHGVGKSCHALYTKVIKATVHWLKQPMLGKHYIGLFHSKQCKGTRLFDLPIIYRKVYVLCCNPFDFLLCYKSKHSEIREKEQDKER